MEEDIRRLFLGMEATVPWPERLPNGRILDPSHRHITLAFLGATDYPKLMSVLSDFSPPPFQVGLAGKLDKCLFFPLKRKPPRVVAWNVNLMDDTQPLLDFQKDFVEWLTVHGFLPDDAKRKWVPHITIARSPFYPREWKKAFHDLPIMCNTLHLYESVGNLNYETRWQYNLKPAFEELEHTADLAFTVRAENIQQLHHHAAIALAFHFPPFLTYCSDKERKNTLEDIIISLNEAVTTADAELGCPFKAVSFHGEVMQEEDGTLKWEMIIDV